MFFEILQTPGNRSLKRKRRTLEMTILRLRFRLQYRPFLDPLVQSAQLLNAQAKDARQRILRLRVRLRFAVRQFLPLAPLFGAFLSAIGNGDRGAEVTVSNTSASLDASPRAEASASLDPDDSPRKTRKATEVSGREEVAFAQMPLVRPTRC